MSSGGGIIGLDPERRTDEAEFLLGTVGWTDDGKAWRYVQANGALRANNCALIKVHQAEPLTLTNDNQINGPAGILRRRAFADEEYGFLQIYGESLAEVNGAVAVNGVPIPTAEGGRITDGGTEATGLLGIYFHTVIADNAVGALVYFLAVDEFRRGVSARSIGQRKA